MTATLAPLHPDTESYVAEALAVAHQLVDLDVPVFVAHPARRPDGSWDPAGGAGGCGYWLPREWQLTRPDHSAVDAWQTGDALGAVGGYGLDFIDTDPRNGGIPTRDALVGAGVWPTVYGRASTPSGGTHELVRPLGIGKGKIEPGIDVQAGTRDRSDHGFIFVAPTVRLSRKTEKIVPYTWSDLTLDEVDDRDDSGVALAHIVESRRPATASTPAAGSAPPTAAGSYATASAPRNEHTGPIPEGSRHDALVSYAGYLRTRGVGPDLAEPLMLLRLADCAQPPEARSRFTEGEALKELHDIYGRYAGGTPDLEPVEVDENGARINPLRARLFDREALRLIPPVRWLVEGTLPEHSVTVLSGRTQTLKTFLALDMALSHATGKEWFGRAAGRGRVLLVLAEGFDGIAGRIAAWGAEHGDVPRDALTVLRGAVQLAEAQQMADLAEIVAEDGYSLVVLDTYAKMTVGLVENSNDDATTATAALYRIADATTEGRGAVLVIAHATKYRDDGTGKRTARGAGALTDNIDGQYDLERISETEVLVERTKVKEAELHDTFRMTFRPSGPSIVLDYAEIGAEDIPVRKNGQALEVDRQQERVLALLARGKALDASSVGSSIGVSDVTALKYLRRLHKLEKVQEGGTERHRFYSLAGPP